MIAFDEALALVESTVEPMVSETVALADAPGRVLAQSLHAQSDAPPQAVAAMDGYAVADATTQPGKALRVIGESRAGAGLERVVQQGEAVRIFTGAPMPDGTDRCVMQEYATPDGAIVRFSEGYGPGWHVRAAGSDFRTGDMLLPAGTLLAPQTMVAAAAADVASLEVTRRPRVALISTGDELTTPGSAHEQPGAIPESVSFGVAAMAETAGARIVARYSGMDDLPELQVLAGAALADADLVIVTGGASVGERDFAKPMFAPHGLDLLFAKVAIKPGKPVWLGRAKDRWVLGLPGNPTSAMVTARLFLKPLLARLQGQVQPAPLRWRRLPLAAPLRATGPRETFVRARWDEGGLTPLHNQDSSAQRALAADWLIRCPADQASSDTGENVMAVRF